MKVIHNFHAKEIQLLLQKNPFQFHMEFSFLELVYEFI
jgi:hypothetical protein